MYRSRLWSKKSGITNILEVTIRNVNYKSLNEFKGVKTFSVVRLCVFIKKLKGDEIVFEWENARLRNRRSFNVSGSVSESRRNVSIFLADFDECRFTKLSMFLSVELLRDTSLNLRDRSMFTVLKRKGVDKRSSEANKVVFPKFLEFAICNKFVFDGNSIIKRKSESSNADKTMNVWVEFKITSESVKNRNYTRNNSKLFLEKRQEEFCEQLEKECS